MSYEQETKDIESRFAANFSSLPVKYRNTNFSPEANQSFCELIITVNDSIRASIGVDSPLHRNYGIIIANMFVPKGTGTYTAKQYADEAAAIFRDAQFSGITCRSPAVREIGNVQSWFVVSMMCHFFHDNIF